VQVFTIFRTRDDRSAGAGTLAGVCASALFTAALLAFLTSIGAGPV
jgi:hypothetical protein